MQKSYSQKIARVFEIICYLLMLPAAFAVFMGLILLFVSPLWTILVYAVLIVGIYLFVGYYKHSRGRLDEKYFSALWIMTAVYNLPSFLFWLYYASTWLESGNFQETDGKLSEGRVILFFMVLVMVFGFLSAVVSAIKAYSFEKRKKHL